MYFFFKFRDCIEEYNIDNEKDDEKTEEDDQFNSAGGALLVL